MLVRVKFLLRCKNSISAFGIWGNEEPRWGGQYRGIWPKKAVYKGGGAGLLTYTWVITEIYHPTLILSDDDVIYGR